MGYKLWIANIKEADRMSVLNLLKMTILYVIMVITILVITESKMFYRKCPEYHCKNIHWTQEVGMCSNRRLAIVTGGNKGLGLAIVKGLSKKFHGDIILTGRRDSAGLAAVREVQDGGDHVFYHHLDITNPRSIGRLAEYIKANYEGVDILVNNAGVDALSSQLLERTAINMDTNFWGTMNVSNKLFPLLKPHASVVNVASISAKDAIRLCSESIKERFKDEHLTMDKVRQLIMEFTQSIFDGTYREKGWPKSPYGISKAGVVLMTKVQQSILLQDEREDITCCPGDVATEMTGFQGDKTTEEGADTPLYLAMLPPYTTSTRGQLVVDRKVVRFP